MAQPVLLAFQLVFSWDWLLFHRMLLGLARYNEKVCYKLTNFSIFRIGNQWEASKNSSDLLTSYRNPVNPTKRRPGLVNPRRIEESMAEKGPY